MALTNDNEKFLHLQCAHTPWPIAFAMIPAIPRQITAPIMVADSMQENQSLCRQFKEAQDSQELR